MANPNIANLTSILGQTSVLDATTTRTSILSNPGASGKVYKINTLLLTNVDGTNTVAITVEYTNSGGTTYLAKLMNLPGKTSISIIDKNTPIYLMEADTIYIEASASGDAQAIISYEVIS